MTRDGAVTILTIEDDEAVRESIVAFLEDRGYHVLEAADGREGLDIFRRDRPDLILVDLRMPEIDGLEVVAEITTEAADTPLIVVSGTGVIADAIEAVHRGAWDYILKPIEDMGVLQHAVQRALERSELIRTKQEHRQQLERLVQERTSELQAANEALRSILHGTARAVGDKFFRSLVRHLATALHVRYAMIAELLEGNRVRTHAVWTGNDFAENVDYALAGTPCENVIGQSTCLYRQGVQQQFPDDTILKEMGVESYLGTPLCDAAGNVIGLLAVLNDAPMEETPLAVDLLHVFAARAGAELGRKRAAEALRETQKRYRTLFETMAEGVVYQDTEGRIISANPSAERILGFAAKEMLGKRSGDAQWGAIREDGSPLPDDDHPAMIALRTGKPVKNVIIGIRNARDGQTRWILINATPVFRQGETTPWQVYATFNDITDRKRAEEDYGMLFNGMIDGFAVHEIILDDAGRPIDYRYIAANPAFEEMTGLSAEKIVGKTVRELLPRIEPHWIENFGKVALTGEPCRFENYSEDLRKHFQVVAFRPQPGQFACIFVDITERKQAEEALRESEERFRRYYELGLIGMAVTSPDMKWLHFNDRLCEFFGYSAEELARKTWSELTHPDDLAADVAQFERVMAGEIDGYSMEKRYVRKDGQVIYASMSAKCLRRADGSVDHFVALIQDITDRKQSEQEREELIARLEAQNAELERFTYTVSHDLKAPLITVKGYLGALQEDLAGGDHEAVQDDLGRMDAAADRMLELLNDLLELSRIGRLVNPPEQVSLGAIARESMELIHGRIDERGVRVEIQPDLPIVYGDRPRLLEVLQNLIDNAVKYLGDQPDPRIEIGSRPGDGETIYYVRDNGMGIERRYHEKVFGLFDQLDPDVEGSGIGLALVKRIVEVHGGRIWVESEGRGRGATFCFTLPPSPETNVD